MRRLRSIIGGITSATALFAALQAPTAGTPLTLAATVIPATAGQLFLTAAPVTLTSAANLSAGKYTVIGTDRRGNALSEVITGPNANTVSGHFLFGNITSITPDTTSASTVSAGVAGVHFGPWLISAFHLSAPIMTILTAPSTSADVMTTSQNLLSVGDFQADPTNNSWVGGEGLIVPQPATKYGNGDFPLMPASLQTAAPWLKGTNLVLPEDDGTWSGMVAAPTLFTSAAPATGSNTGAELRLDPTAPFAWRLKLTGAAGLIQLDVNLLRPALS